MENHRENAFYVLKKMFCCDFSLIASWFALLDATRASNFRNCCLKCVCKEFLLFPSKMLGRKREHQSPHGHSATECAIRKMHV